MHVPGFLRFPALVRERRSDAVVVTLVRDGRTFPALALPPSIFELVPKDAGLVDLVVVPGEALGGTSMAVELHGADGWWGKGKLVMRGVFVRGDLLTRDEENARLWLDDEVLVAPAFAFAHVEPGPCALGAFAPSPHEPGLGHFGD